MIDNQTAAARRVRVRQVDDQRIDVTTRRQPRPAPRRQGTRRAAVLAAIREG